MVGIFSYVLLMTVVKAMGVKHDYPVDAKQELLALGAANLCGGCFGAYPAAGSLSRSALSVELTFNFITTINFLPCSLRSNRTY